MKQTNTYIEAQTAIDEWMQALETLPFIDFKEKGRWIHSNNTNPTTHHKNKGTSEAIEGTETRKNTKAQLRHSKQTPTMTQDTKT